MHQNHQPLEYMMSVYSLNLELWWHWQSLLAFGITFFICIFAANHLLTPKRKPPLLVFMFFSWKVSLLWICVLRLVSCVFGAACAACRIGSHSLFCVSYKGRGRPLWSSQTMLRSHLEGSNRITDNRNIHHSKCDNCFGRFFLKRWICKFANNQSFNSVTACFSPS